MNIEEQYLDLLRDILQNGVVKSDRTGTGTKSVFGRQLVHDMKEGFPLLTTKKMSWKNIVVELLWFLNGDTNIKYLVDNNCMIWNGDAFKSYCRKNNIDFAGVLPENLEEAKKAKLQEFIDNIKSSEDFADEWGDLGPIYGRQWRCWSSTIYQKLNFRDPLTDEPVYSPTVVWVDQIDELIQSIKKDPDSRRLMVTAWNPGELSEMVLPPCHYGFQCYTKELSQEERWKLAGLNPTKQDFDWASKLCNDFDVPTRSISLMWNQRSVDTPLGLPYNIASYALLLEIIAKECNMVTDQLKCNLGDTHIYLNQMPGVIEQISRIPSALPKLEINAIFAKKFNVDAWKPEDFKILNYTPLTSIKFPLSN